jgi:hypothetical protein
MVVSKAILPTTLSYSSFKLFISSDSRDTAASGMKKFVFNYLQKHFNPVVSKIFRVTLLHCVFCPRRIRLHGGNKCEQLGTIQHLGPVKWNVQPHCHPAISYSRVFHPTLRITKQQITRSHSLAYAVHVLTRVVLFSRILLFNLLPLNSIMKSKRKFNPLKPSGNYMNHLLWQSLMLHFVFIGFEWFSL